jgi:outer membrane receptor protein involved in Fe transport
MKKTLTLLFCIQAFSSLFSQNAFIKGIISDSKTKETIVGGSVVIDDATGTATDMNGAYFFKMPSGKHKVEFKYVGYKSQLKTITANENDTLKFNVALEQDSKTLDIVVVSAGKFEQKISDVTVSMEVIKPTLIENKALTKIDKAIDQVPGVNVIDGQANIRGGSGFSYGAGSRVLIMVDEMPMLTAGQGDVKWSFLPIENCEQIEVIKGASSALFGSSAMNGVINFRTAYAKDEPETKIVFSGGIYDRPKRKELIWWTGSNPAYSGINFYHSEKIGQLDLVVGGNVFNDDGYRASDQEQRYRFNANLRYRFKKVPGLAVGVNFNDMTTKGELFFLWARPDSALFPTGGKNQPYSAVRTSVDPFITFNGKDGSRQSLRTRYFHTLDLNSTDQSNSSDMYYSEYQYQKQYGNGITWTSGAVYNYGEVHSGTIYGNHFSNNIAVFAQFDKKFDRLTTSLGVRGEYYKTDAIETKENINLLMDPSKPLAKASKVKPVLRAGANYRLADFTFLRASFGQGFRFPTIAERYIRTGTGGLNVYPNDSLKPESGWSAELAIKQGVKLGSWKGFVDLAGFWSEYRNMMEFTFGQYGVPTPPYNTASLLGLGFQSQNIGNTRIRGFEISIMGEGKMGPINVTTLLGYTYVDPRQTDFNLAVDSVKNTVPTNLLKYRYQHTGKADVQLEYKKWSTGLSVRANSYMENIDKVFGENESSFPGMAAYRAQHDKGDAVFDYRIGYQLDKTSKIAFVVNNLFNREVMDRPASILPQRCFIAQLTVKL